MDDGKPLLRSKQEEEVDKQEHQKQNLGPTEEFVYESKKLWQIAGPAIFTAFCQYSLGALTQTFAGLIGDLELAAVSFENSVIAGLAFGVMVFTISVSSCFHLGIFGMILD